MAIVRHKKKASKPAAKECVVDIHNLSHEAQGVSRSQDKVLFVAGALPTEQVKVRIDKQMRHFNQGQLLEVIIPSSERVAPLCPHYKRCGACQLQHLDSSKQLGYKQQDLAHQLTRNLKLDEIPWQKGMDSDAFGYRRRARLGVRYRKQLDEIVLGFREEANSHLTAISECPVLDPRLGTLLKPIHSLISTLEAKSKITQVELIAGDQDVAVVIRHLKQFHTTDLNKLKDWAKEQAVQLWAQGDKENVCLYPESVQDLNYQIDDLTLSFGVKDFIQGNAQLNKAMVQQAIDWLAPKQNETVLDLFAGIGNFTLPLAKQVNTVFAVEGEKSMAQRIDQNAQANGIDNIQASAMNLADEELLFRLPKVDAILLDPPRTGASDLMPWLAAQTCRILYVACDPSALIRDAQPLLKAGYRLDKISVMDMFPQTKHVESMALFIKD